MCEGFNGKLLHGRDKPIITCLEYIMEYLMNMICVVQKEIDKFQGLLTQTATILLEGIKNEAGKYKAIFVGDGK